jgi:hypothetical protein
MSLAESNILITPNLVYKLACPIRLPGFNFANSLWHESSVMFYGLQVAVPLSFSSVRLSDILSAAIFTTF